MLYDENTNKKLASDPTQTYNNKLKHLIEEGVYMGLMTKKTG